MAVAHFTEQDFEQEVLKSGVPVLIDFWAEWCAPCRMIGPVIEELAEEFAGKAKVGKVNVDEARQLAMQYNVMAIPTLLFIKNGEVVDQVMGVAGKEQLSQKLNAIL